MWAVTRFALLALTASFLFLQAYAQRSRAPSPLAVWDQWDTHWYLRIAEQGYGIRETANFFPLYPMLTGSVARLLALAAHVPATHGLYVAAGLAVSNLAALVAFVALARLADGEGEDGPLTVALLSAYPFAFFLAAAYTEGLFLALAALALLSARRGRWGSAAIACFLAGLTRSAAVVLVLPVLYEVCRQQGIVQLVRRRDWRPILAARRLLPVLVLAAAVPLAFALYMGFLWLRFGDPLLFVHTQQSIWHHQLTPPWSTLARALAAPLHGWTGLEPVDLGLVLLAALLTLLGARRLPFAFTLYTAGLLLLLLSTPIAQRHDLLASAGRYLTVAIPCFLLVESWARTRRWLQLLVMSTGFMLQAVLATVFLAGGPVY